jgi:hypothetical protein
MPYSSVSQKFPASCAAVIGRLLEAMTVVWRGFFRYGRAGKLGSEDNDSDIFNIAISISMDGPREGAAINIYISTSAS